MNLTQYIESFPRFQKAIIYKRFAKVLCVSESFVRSMCNGTKKIPAKYAIQIEIMTNGAVPRFVTAPTHYPVEQYGDQTCTNMHKFIHQSGLIKIDENVES